MVDAAYYDARAGSDSQSISLRLHEMVPVIGWGVSLLVPFELFFPIPSLSTTSCLHRICRVGVSSRASEASSSALSLSVPVTWIFDVLSCTREIDETRELDVGFWEVSWRPCDITASVEELERFEACVIKINKRLKLR